MNVIEQFTLSAKMIVAISFHHVSELLKKILKRKNIRKDAPPLSAPLTDHARCHNEALPLGELQHLPLERRAFRNLWQPMGAEWATSLRTALPSAQLPTWPPAFKPFDHYGWCIDQVEYHASYHHLMDLGLRGGHLCVGERRRCTSSLPARVWHVLPDDDENLLLFYPLLVRRAS